MDKNKLPVFLQRCEIELSSMCNLKCVYCPRKYVDGLAAFMEWRLFKKIIDELEPYPETILALHRRGESLLHPKISEFIDYIKGKFKTIQLATNGTLLDEKISQKLIRSISFISFSLDVPDVFDRTRTPANYAKTEKKILRFLAMNKGKVKTQVSMVRAPETDPESVKTFYKIWKQKVDRIRIYEEHSSDGKFGSLRLKRKNRSACTMPFYEMVVFSDGMVGRCNHDWNGTPLGTLNETTIQEIWHSPKYYNLRTQHQKLTITDSVCRDCDSWYPVTGRQMTGETYESAA